MPHRLLLHGRRAARMAREGEADRQRAAGMRQTQPPARSTRGHEQAPASALINTCRLTRSPAGAQSQAASLAHPIRPNSPVLRAYFKLSLFHILVESVRRFAAKIFTVPMNCGVGTAQAHCIAKAAQVVGRHDRDPPNQASPRGYRYGGPGTSFRRIRYRLVSSACNHCE